MTLTLIAALLGALLLAAQPERDRAARRGSSADDAAQLDTSGSPTSPEGSGASSPGPVPARYEPVEAEPYPNAKRFAARVIHELTNYEVADAPAEVLDDYGGRSFTDVVHADHLHVEVGS